MQGDRTGQTAIIFLNRRTDADDAGYAEAAGWNGSQPPNPVFVGWTAYGTRTGLASPSVGGRTRRARSPGARKRTMPRSATPAAPAGTRPMRSPSPASVDRIVGPSGDRSRSAEAARPPLRAAVRGDADDRGRQHRTPVGASRARPGTRRRRQRGRRRLLGLGAAVGDRGAILGDPIRSARTPRDDPAGPRRLCRLAVDLRGIPGRRNKRLDRGRHRVRALHRRAADLRHFRRSGTARGAGAGRGRDEPGGTHPRADVARLRVRIGNGPRPGCGAVSGAGQHRRRADRAGGAGVRRGAGRGGHVDRSPRDAARRPGDRGRPVHDGSRRRLLLSLDRWRADRRQRTRRDRQPCGESRLARSAHPRLDDHGRGERPCAGDGEPGRRLSW